MQSRKIKILIYPIKKIKYNWLMIHYNPKARLKIRKAKKIAHRSRMKNG